MMGIVLPETCWASNKVCNKYHLLHLVGILFPYNQLNVSGLKYISYRLESNCGESGEMFCYVVASRMSIGNHSLFYTKEMFRLTEFFSHIRNHKLYQHCRILSSCNRKTVGNRVMSWDERRNCDDVSCICELSSFICQVYWHNFTSNK